MLLSTLRRRGAPVALVLHVTLVAGMLPSRRVRAEEEPTRSATPAVTSTSATKSTPSQVGKSGAPVARGVSSGSLSPMSLPADGTSKTGVSSQAISLPQGTGKIQGMGESFSTQLSTGVASFSVPFALVPARGGAQPSLTLSYSSASGAGVAGMGWDVGVAFIARQTDRGLPRYQDPAQGGAWAPTQDRFIFNGGQELIPICLVSGTSCDGALAGEQMPSWASGWQYFRPRVEGGFLRFFWSPDHQTWRVQSKTGTSMELGAPLDGSAYTGALEQDPGGLGHIFRWDLVREYDAYGTPDPSGDALPAPVNIVSYRYEQDGGMAYLSDVYDTPPAANPSSASLSAYAHHAHLLYETRTDPTVSFRRGWETTTSLRLSGVDVTSQTFAGGGNRQLVRRYHLAYDPAYHVSLLTSVQEEGRCATSEGGAGSVAEDATGSLPVTTGCPTLPPMTFEYQHVTGFTLAGAPQTSDLPGYEPFDERVIPFSASPPNSIDEDLTDLFDVNADGLPDVLVTNPGAYNGNFGLYLNSTGGQANTFAALSTMAVYGVPSETAGVLTLNNLNVSAADINGDGIVDLLHMPQVKTYSVYTPTAVAGGYAWVGQAITTASQQSPKLDFGDDAQNIQVMDVNGDGLVDVVYSAGDNLQTFFSLGRYAEGNAQFGSATWTGPTTAQIDNDPVQYCLPYAGLPVNFNDSNTKLADMNGDGLPDIVYVQQGNVVYWPGRGNGYFGTGDPTACPAGSFAANTDVAMASSPWYSDPNGAMVRLDDVNGDGLDDLVQIGMNYVEIWLNVDGTSWTGEHIIQNSPPAPSYANRVRLVDANGNGTRDVLWGDASSYKFIDLQGGVRPWVLTHIANGLGKTTEVAYESSTELMIDAAAAGAPWSSVMPMPAHVVTQVTDRDNLDLVGRPGGVYVTQYTYRDPVYDGRQREFRGFQSATTTRVGDANSPTSTTSSTFLLGQCQNDENEVPDPCTDDGRWRDNPREALKGLPLLSETYDAGGTYLSTTHHTYRLRKLYAGLDGREVRYAFESQSDSYHYDDAPFTAGAQATTLADVELETTLGTVQTDTAESLSLRSTASRAHLHKTAAVDPFGNATAQTDDGCVDGCPSVDESIITNSVPGLVACNSGGWMYRTTRSYVTGSQTSGTRRDTSTQYDCGGNPTIATAILGGAIQLDRYTSVAHALEPSTESVNGPILMANQSYDPLGRVRQQRGPNGRCRQIGYDNAYDELATSEIVYVGGVLQTPGQAPPTPCLGTGLTALAPMYDRGLHLPVQVVDIHSELTTAAYDGFGRLTTQTKPDPQAVGKTSAVASVLITYCLPGDPGACGVSASSPYSLVHTQSQDGPDTSTVSYRDSYAFVDGLGRTIATLDQADTNAGDDGQWVVNGLTSYDAKGAAQRSYLAWFWSGTAQVFPLGAVPVTPYGRQRYDAFGRQLQTFALDGTVSLQSAYHARSVDKWDAADLMPGPHQGTPATGLLDGHGRTISFTERVHGIGGIEARETRTTYLPTGEPTVITRVNDATGAQVTRTIQYDTLGRMVLNTEPDMSTGPHAWRYVYDDNGDLVGTSDARGCGANYLYDVGGRIVWEDFSPCLESQPTYSTPDPATGNGTEAYYEYDAPDPDAASIPSPFPINAALQLGRLTGVVDRGAKTVTSYDGRGRVIGVARRMAGPLPSGIAEDDLEARYAPHWYVQTEDYDGADRAIVTTTGADIAELLDVNGKSVVTTAYSKRGTVSSVGSGYGLLVKSVARAADGLVNSVVYGDTARTTSFLNYDSRRRLSSVQTYRGPPALWATEPPDPLGASDNTFQLLLQDLSYSYDAVDNPTQVRDSRNPAEWPSGAQPVTRTIQYDDLYRVTNVAYAYPGGKDPWTSPFESEDEGFNLDPRRATPSPHVAFDNRVVDQSFQYDWLGNTTSTDDDSHGFYDRSLGAVTNGTATKGPYQLQTAQGVASSARGGALSTAYDEAGNLTSLTVTRSGPCLPSGASCSQRFVYEWDEIGRLVDARRWDGAAGAASDPIPIGTASAELRYAYDASDQRMLKTAVGARDGADAQTVYPLNSLELRRSIWDGADYERNNATEVGYLFSHGMRLARLHYALDSEPTASSGNLHVLFELSDHLGSTSAVFDRETSELVEAATYLPYGGDESTYRPRRWGSFREDYGFTKKEEDVELGLAYFGRRYLGLQLGRWTSPDPAATHALGADPNLYAYVNGRSLRAIDLVGLDGTDYLVYGTAGFVAEGVTTLGASALDPFQFRAALSGLKELKTGYDCVRDHGFTDAANDQWYAAHGVGTSKDERLNYELTKIPIAGRIGQAIAAKSDKDAAWIGGGAGFQLGMLATVVDAFGGAKPTEPLPNLGKSLHTGPTGPAAQAPAVDLPPAPPAPPPPPPPSGATPAPGPRALVYPDGLGVEGPPLEVPVNKVPRRPADLAREALGTTPAANKGDGTIGSNPSQALQLARDIMAANEAGATDIRVNQEQVDVSGNRVGRNRPDLSYNLNGKRINIEYDTASSARGMPHAERIVANDPAAEVHLKTVP